jgi:hypothetical protein
MINAVSEPLSRFAALDVPKFLPKYKITLRFIHFVLSLLSRAIPIESWNFQVFS